MSRRRRITSKGRELIKKRSYYDRYTLRSCRPKFSKKGTRRNTYCLLRRSKSRKRRSKSKKRRSKRDGMDDEEEFSLEPLPETKNEKISWEPLPKTKNGKKISWESLHKTKNGIRFFLAGEEDKIDWTGFGFDELIARIVPYTTSTSNRSKRSSKRSSKKMSSKSSSKRRK